jgi:hypothetical protein
VRYSCQMDDIAIAYLEAAARCCQGSTRWLRVCLAGSPDIGELGVAHSARDSLSKALAGQFNLWKCRRDIENRKPYATA